MYLLLRHTNFKSICSISRLYSLGRKTHYEVLRLPRNCSEKEIKEAFVQLSKEYHPDKNKHESAKEHFVRIVEAYNILGKPSSRAKYDGTTVVEAGSFTQSEYGYRPHVPYNLRNNPNYSYFYENRDKSKDSKSKQKIYEDKPSKRISKFFIVLMCFSTVVVGFILQMYLVRESFLIRQHQAEVKTKLLTEELDKIRSAALENGNDKQTRLLLDHIARQSNPTVATAKLGQALANERKE